MKANARCRACASPYTLHVQDVVGVRSGRRYPQFFCMDCQSFFHTSGYRETEVQHRRDCETLAAERANHASIQSELCLEIVSRLPGIRSCCEVGFGLGWFLKACRDYSISATGYEVNPYCYEYATDTLGLSCHLGAFDDSSEGSYDLIVALHVMEHLEEPRELFRVMAKHLNRDGAIYLSVPFAHRHDWRYLWTADSKPGNGLPDIFFDNDVHITHFSVEGMRQMGLGLGARSAEYWISRDTFHQSPGSYHGILFRF